MEIGNLDRIFVVFLNTIGLSWNSISK